MRRRASREETTTRILDAAEELFSRRDPDKVTIREIADSAGITHPLVHQYVGTKQDVLNAVIERGAPARHRIIAQHPTFKDAFPLVAHDVVSKTISSRAILRAAMDDTEYANHEQRRQNMRDILSLLQKARDAGENREAVRPDAVDPRLALAASVSLLLGWVAIQEWAIELLDIDVDELDAEQFIIDLSVTVAEFALPAKEPAE